MNAVVIALVERPTWPVDMLPQWLGPETKKVPNHTGERAFLTDARSNLTLT